MNVLKCMNQYMGRQVPLGKVNYHQLSKLAKNTWKIPSRSLTAKALEKLPKGPNRGPRIVFQPLGFPLVGWRYLPPWVGGDGLV